MLRRTSVNKTCVIETPVESEPKSFCCAKPTLWDIAPLPLTTAMDYFDVMPDNGIDGIVNTPANLSSFGNDSGVVTFTAQNGMAQTLLPVNVSTGGTLPVNDGYLIQGGPASKSGRG